MLKEKIVNIQLNKKQKFVSDVLVAIVKEPFYQRIKLIGQGTFGKVYLARSKKDGREYALKEVLQDKRYKNRELSLISRIEHCNIIGMKEYFLKMVNDSCILVIIMDCFPSCLNLLIRDQRKFKKPFSPIIRKLIAFQLFKALYYLQVCHRDIKPPNILIHDVTYELKLCDFGSAKLFEKEENNVTYICSRYYRAPELVLQAADHGLEIDMWSAGCIIVQLLTLEPIFPGDSSQEQLIEIIKILGTPPQKYIDLYQCDKQTQYHLPNIKPSAWQVVLHKYEPEPELIDIISRILTYDSKSRLQPLEGLKHSYFSDLSTYSTYTQKIPHLFYFSDLQNNSNSKQIDELIKLYPFEQPLKEKKKKDNSQQVQLESLNTCSS